MISRTLNKIKAEKAEGILVVPYWPHQTGFPVLLKMLIDTPVFITSRRNLWNSLASRTGAPHLKENRYGSLSLGRFIAESKGISKQAEDILEASSRGSTRKRYAVHVQQFTQYFHQRNVDPFQGTTKKGIDYLTEYFHTRVGYSSVNTSRSALSTIIKTENKISLEELRLECRFIKDSRFFWIFQFTASSTKILYYMGCISCP